MTDRTDRSFRRAPRVTVLTPGLAAALILLATGGLVFLAGPPEQSSTANPTLGTHPGVVKTLTFSSDGRTLGVGRRDGSVSLWNVASRRVRFRLPPRTLPNGGVAFSPDLSAVAVGGSGSVVSVVDTSTGDETRTVAAEVGPPRSLAYSPDGSSLAARGPCGRITRRVLQRRP
jgi:WD40 repeat protein